MGLSIRKYSKKDCITFKSTKGRNGALSNMAPGFPIFLHGNMIKTSEALYQALRFPDFPEIQKEILNFNSPISGKKFGQTHIEKTRADWNIQRFKIMRFCIDLKLHFNAKKFTKVLLATKDLSIVEYTDKDKVWGATDEGLYYEGTNALGRLLMQLREEVKNDIFHLKIPDIENLKFLGKEINIESIKSAPTNG